MVGRKASEKGLSIDLYFILRIPWLFCVSLEEKLEQLDKA